MAKDLKDLEQGSFCQKCGQHFLAHNDDGSCVVDALPKPKHLVKMLPVRCKGCGSEAEVVPIGSEHFQVMCVHEECWSGPIRTLPSMAVELWNRIMIGDK